jgi:membrane-bound lytic murein transglycosylase
LSIKRSAPSAGAALTGFSVVFGFCAVMAQDTGSAIVGAARVDYFWGTDPQAEQQAGRMKQPLKVWALWPR